MKTNSGAERRAHSYWVSGALRHSQLPATHTDTFVELKATLPSLQEFLPNQAKDLCICSTPNMVPALCAASPPMFWVSQTQTRKKTRDRLPTAAESYRSDFSSFNMSRECGTAGKTQIHKLTVDPELLF